MESLKNKSVIVSGGTGFIGSVLIDKLVAGGIKTICLGRSRAKYDGLTDNLLERGLEPHQISDDLSFIKINLAKPETIAKSARDLEDGTVLIHLAAEVSGQRDVNQFGPALVDQELKGTIRLLNAMPNLERVGYASSMAVYGRPYDHPVTESTKTEPENIYGICKLTMEKLLRLFSGQENIPVGIVRFSSVYGPGNTSTRAIPTFIKAVLNSEPIVIHGDGKQLRDYLYVDDAAAAVLSTLSKDGFGIYNIGAGAGCSTNDLLALLTKVSGKDDIDVKYEPLADSTTIFDFVYDMTKAMNELGFEPKVTLKDGLKKEYDWHESNRND